MTLGNMIDACAEIVGTGGMIESAEVDSLGQLETNLDVFQAILTC